VLGKCDVTYASRIGSSWGAPQAIRVHTHRCFAKALKHDREKEGGEKKGGGAVGGLSVLRARRSHS
jgi:hypothetical protein